MISNVLLLKKYNAQSQTRDFVGYKGNTFVVDENESLPDELEKNKYASSNNALKPLSIASLGVLSALSLGTFIIKKNVNANFESKRNQRLQAITRNIAINEESFQGVYQMIQNPTKKNIIAASGVIILGIAAFIGKMFVDGFKDIWVKKQEADITKNLKENLISVETREFSGKMQIIRKIYSDKERYFKHFVSKRFGQNDEEITFKGQNKPKEDTSSLKFYAAGAFTIAGILALTYSGLKNMSKAAKTIESVKDKLKDELELLIKNAKTSKSIDLNSIKRYLLMSEASEKEIAAKMDILKKSGIDSSQIEQLHSDILDKRNHSVSLANAAMAGDGTPKPAFYSHVDDYRAFFYNWLLEAENPAFKALFIAISTLSAGAYIGKSFGEALKDVQVKKTNAQTELELQDKLVSTELRNFKAKKDASIEPLMERFNHDATIDKSEKEIRDMASSILYEVKNGAPFVYA